MRVNTCLINGCLSSVSVVIRSWFIYKLQRSTTIAFSRNSLCSFYSRNPTFKIPPSLGISNRKYPPPPHSFGIPGQRTHPLPFRNPKSRPWYRYGYFLLSPNFLACSLEPGSLVALKGNGAKKEILASKVSRVVYYKGKVQGSLETLL